MSLLNPDDTAATITWTTINCHDPGAVWADDQLELFHPLLTALVTNHAALLTNLTPATGYYFAAYSQVGANVYVSSNFFFTTTNYVTTNDALRSYQYLDLHHQRPRRGQLDGDQLR